MPKKTTKKPTIREAQSTLYELANNLAEDKKYQRFRTNVLTFEFIDSIPKILDKLKIENPEKYLYFSNQFISIFLKHDIAIIEDKRKQEKLEIEKKRLELESIRVQKLFDSQNEDAEEVSYQNAVEEAMNFSSSKKK